MKTLNELLKQAIAIRASDIIFTVGVPICYRVNGSYGSIDKEVLKPEDTERYVKEILGDEQFERLLRDKELDTTIRVNGYNFRVGAYTQKGSLSASLRILSNRIKSFEELGLPKGLEDMCQNESGLFLITGTTGSGKSTTMASMIEYINEHRSGHIITIEDPIEFIFTSKKCIIDQKELGKDTLSYANSLKSVLREDPDIIAIGEMRSPETIASAITCAETGHLVISTLHTSNVAGTVSRIIDAFDPSMQAQIRTQLSMSLCGVISQKLLPSASGVGRVVLYEYAPFTQSLKALIRTGKTHLIEGQIEIGKADGMISYQKTLNSLYDSGQITKEVYDLNTMI